MMKAEATAENRPACDTNQHTCAVMMCATYEYQGHIQIVLIFLPKFLIAVLRLLVVVFVEFFAKIFML